MAKLPDIHTLPYLRRRLRLDPATRVRIYAQPGKTKLGNVKWDWKVEFTDPGDKWIALEEARGGPKTWADLDAAVKTLRKAGVTRAELYLLAKPKQASSR